MKIILKVIRPPTLLLLCTLIGLAPTQDLQDSMVLIPTGSYQMGSSDDKNFKRAGHPETINSFYLAKYEVTVAEFEQFIEATNYETDADRAGESMILVDNHPEAKSGINWKYDASGIFKQTNYITNQKV